MTSRNGGITRSSSAVSISLSAVLVGRRIALFPDQAAFARDSNRPPSEPTFDSWREQELGRRRIGGSDLSTEAGCVGALAAKINRRNGQRRSANCRDC